MGKYTQRIRREARRRADDAWRRRVYRCGSCGQYTITIVTEADAVVPVTEARGAVPDNINCRATDDCTGRASLVDPPHELPAGVPPDPRWEWYRPDPAAWDRLRRHGGPLWEHIHRGGLLIRRRRTASR